jgi:hypothetical protein
MRTARLSVAPVRRRMICPASNVSLTGFSPVSIENVISALSESVSVWTVAGRSGSIAAW